MRKITWSIVLGEPQERGLMKYSNTTPQQIQWLSWRQKHQHPVMRWHATRISQQTRSTVLEEISMTRYSNTHHFQGHSINGSRSLNICILNPCTKTSLRGGSQAVNGAGLKQLSWKESYQGMTLEWRPEREWLEISCGLEQFDFLHKQRQEVMRWAMPSQVRKQGCQSTALANPSYQRWLRKSCPPHSSFLRTVLKIPPRLWAFWRPPHSSFLRADHHWSF